MVTFIDYFFLSQLNKEEFENLPDELRVELEGYRAGMYVRIEISSMPCELVEYFDPTFPLIVGGLLPNEENIGYLQVNRTFQLFKI